MINRILTPAPSAQVIQTYAGDLAKLGATSVTATDPTTVTATFAAGKDVYLARVSLRDTVLGAHMIYAGDDSDSGPLIGAEDVARAVSQLDGVVMSKAIGSYPGSAVFTTAATADRVTDLKELFKPQIPNGVGPFIVRVSRP